MSTDISSIEIFLLPNIGIGHKNPVSVRLQFFNKLNINFKLFKDVLVELSLEYFTSNELD